MFRKLARELERYVRGVYGCGCACTVGECDSGLLWFEKRRFPLGHDSVELI